MAYCKNCGGTRDASGACTCDNKDQSLTYFETNGNYKASMNCQTCSSGNAYPTNNPYNLCIPLETGETFNAGTGAKECQTGFTLVGNQCYTDAQITPLNSYPASTANTITYTDQTDTAKSSAKVDNSA